MNPFHECKIPAKAQARYLREEIARLVIEHDGETLLQNAEDIACLASILVAVEEDAEIEERAAYLSLHHIGAP